MQGRGAGREKIGICDGFLMHFGIFRNNLFRIIFRMVFLMHFGFLMTGLKKKIKHLLSGGVIDIFEKFGDIESDIGLWWIY